MVSLVPGYNPRKALRRIQRWEMQEEGLVYTCACTHTHTHPRAWSSSCCPQRALHNYLLNKHYVPVEVAFDMYAHENRLLLYILHEEAVVSLHVLALLLKETSALCHELKDLWHVSGRGHAVLRLWYNFYHGVF